MGMFKPRLFRTRSYDCLRMLVRAPLVYPNVQCNRYIASSLPFDLLDISDLIFSKNLLSQGLAPGSNFLSYTVFPDSESRKGLPLDPSGRPPNMYRG